MDAVWAGQAARALGNCELFFQWLDGGESSAQIPPATPQLLGELVYSQSREGASTGCSAGLGRGWQPHTFQVDFLMLLKELAAVAKSGEGSFGGACGEQSNWEGEKRNEAPHLQMLFCKGYSETQWERGDNCHLMFRQQLLGLLQTAGSRHLPNSQEN